MVQVAKRLTSLRALRFFSAVGLGMFLWLGASCAAQAERSVMLAWDRSQSSTVTGYYVYVLEENSTTPTRVTVANTNQVIIPNLKEGLRYTFNVTAFNTAGESPASNDALFIVPVPLNLTSVNPTNGLRTIQFQGAPGRSYELQASTDLQNWATIWQTDQIAAYGTIGFEDPQSGVLEQRFYRLVVK